MAWSVPAVLAIAIVVLLNIQRSNVQDTSLPIYSAVPSFVLTDSAGSSFSPARVADKVWVVNFIFTSCQGICPRLSGAMVKLQKQFDLDGAVNFVSISVDPETDTPAKLAEYAQGFKADTTRWHFLTGEKNQIKSVMVNAFKIGSDEDPTFHSEYFVLVDQQARIRGYYSFADDQSFTELPKDIRRLLKTRS